VDRAGWFLHPRDFASAVFWRRNAWQEKALSEGGGLTTIDYRFLRVFECRVLWACFRMFSQGLACVDGIRHFSGATGLTTDPKSWLLIFLEDMECRFP
jgi:hypothetical protein